MAGAAFVDHNLGMGKSSGDIANSAGMVEMDVCNHDRCEVVGSHAKFCQGSDDHGGGKRRSGLHQARFGSPNEVTRRDAGMACHLRIDREDVVAKILDDGIWYASLFIHSHTLTVPAIH